MSVCARRLAVVVLCLVSSTFAWAQADFYVSVSDDHDPVMPGSSITYTVEVGNVGDGVSSARINTDINLPPGVPTDLEAYLDGDAAAVAAFDAMLDSAVMDDTIYDPASSGLFVGEDFYCEGFMLQGQALDIGIGVAGTIRFEVTAPSLPTRRAYLGIVAPNLDQEIVSYGRGGCSDIADDCAGIPCMGPRLTTVEPISAPIELADDGGRGASTGCSPLVGFTPGNIALIDRGDCTFELKGVMATNAGASGVIIADSDNFGDSTVDPYDVLNMGCTDFCSRDIITIPMALISWAHGEDLKSDLTGATATMGAIDSERVMHTDALIWENGSSYDTNQTNNSAEESTTVAMFYDGFESGYVSAWSSAVGLDGQPNWGDTFDRPDSEVVGNGWLEDGDGSTTPSIVDHAVLLDNAGPTSGGGESIYRLLPRHIESWQLDFTPIVGDPDYDSYFMVRTVLRGANDQELARIVFVFYNTADVWYSCAGLVGPNSDTSYCFEESALPAFDNIPRQVSIPVGSIVRDELPGVSSQDVASTQLEITNFSLFNYAHVSVDDVEVYY